MQKSVPPIVVLARTEACVSSLKQMRTIFTKTTWINILKIWGWNPFSLQAHQNVKLWKVGWIYILFANQIFSLRNSKKLKDSKVQRARSKHSAVLTITAIIIHHRRPPTASAIISFFIYEFHNKPKKTTFDLWITIFFLKKTTLGEYRWNENFSIMHMYFWKKKTLQEYRWKQSVWIIHYFFKGASWKYRWNEAFQIIVFFSKKRALWEYSCNGAFWIMHFYFWKSITAVSLKPIFLNHTVVFFSRKSTLWSL